jgi:hypothetical protein
VSRRLIPLVKWAIILFGITVNAAVSAPHAAIVIDFDSDEVLFEQNVTLLSVGLNFNF